MISMPAIDIEKLKNFLGSVKVSENKGAFCPCCKSKTVEYEGFTEKGLLWYCYHCDMTFERIAAN